MRHSKKLIWDFEDKRGNIEKIGAVRVTVLDIDADPSEPSNDIFIKIPEGGRCSYSPTIRLFTVFDSEGDIFRTVQAPYDYTLDISLIEKEYFELIETTKHFSTLKN